MSKEGRKEKRVREGRGRQLRAELRRGWTVRGEGWQQGFLIINCA